MSVSNAEKSRRKSPARIQPDAASALNALLCLKNPTKAAFLAGFFKTGKGEYAEGDRFLGITVPQVRQASREFRTLSPTECEKLLQSPYNEVRLLALILLAEHFKKGDALQRESILSIYLRNRQKVNNWNLVDSSAPLILGEYLIGAKHTILDELAESPSLWDRRIAIISTLALIRKNDFYETLRLVKQFLSDKEDLMHKACGWMLREVGKRNEKSLTDFLGLHSSKMPRTMLRYAIEKFPPDIRQSWLRGKTAGNTIINGHREPQP